MSNLYYIYYIDPRQSLLPPPPQVYNGDGIDILFELQGPIVQQQTDYKCSNPGFYQSRFSIILWNILSIHVPFREGVCMHLVAREEIDIHLCKSTPFLYCRTNPSCYWPLTFGPSKQFHILESSLMKTSR